MVGIVMNETLFLTDPGRQSFELGQISQKRRVSSRWHQYCAVAFIVRM